MKKMIMILFVSFCACLGSARSYAQAEEAAQLILNIEKLAQFRQILSDLKKGYDILSGSYTTIKNIAEGNFSLHQVFLDGLLEVSPSVRNYKRVSDIISYQVKIVQEYKKAINRFRNGGNFNAAELNYMQVVYSNLVKGSLKNLDALAMILTSGKTRMRDDERIKAIDGIFRDVEDKLSFLRWFNNSASVLSLQRMKENNDVRVGRELYGQ